MRHSLLFRPFFALSQLIQIKAQYLYGINPIEVALAANRRKIQALIVSDSQTTNPGFRLTKIINTAQEKRIPIQFKPKDKMSRLVKGQPHQNAIIKCSLLSAEPASSAALYGEGLYIYCDKITDPQNLGAIIRSCLFFGVKNIFMPKKSNCPLNSTVSKASSGALQLMHVHSVSKEEQFLQEWRKSGGLVISTSVSSQTTTPVTPSACRELLEKESARKVMIILGSEGQGVSGHLAKNSDMSLCIERRGQEGYPHSLVDSLNVNSALSCILYELSRRK